MSEVLAQLEALRQTGAHHRDPVRFAYLESFATRLAKAVARRRKSIRKNWNRRSRTTGPTRTPTTMKARAIPLRRGTNPR